MFENPRRGRQARNFTTNVPKILDLKSSSEQIFSRKLSLGALDQLSKYLTNVLKPLTEESRHKLQSTENFIDAIKTIQIPDDHKLVSFDVKSLFTSIPLQLALDCTENAIKNSTAELPLPTDDIMDLLNLCLTSTYFQYNGKHYKQLHGTAMGSPVSVVVAEIVMQNIEEQALATYTRTIPIWFRYVDDTFTAVHKDGIDDFHEHLNRQNADIQFTKEIEEMVRYLS